MAELSIASTRRARGSPLHGLLNAIERLAWVDGWIGVACLGTLIALMVTEVTLRALSNLVPALPGGLPFTWEYCSHLMAACFTFGAAMTLRTGGHIRVGFILSHAGARGRQALEIVAAAVGLFGTGFLAVAMVRFTWTSFVQGQVSTSSGTLLWMPQAAVTVGIVLLALQLLARLIQAVLGLPLEDARMKPAASLE
jgi:TRAP-type mannitol/chloroaromatic compound transport system permease small subunit